MFFTQYFSCVQWIHMCLFFSDKEVYSWGKSSRGRLGRSEENTTEPCKILFSGEEPFTVLDLCCSHGNTLLCTKRKCFLFNVFDLSCSHGNTLLCTRHKCSYFSLTNSKSYVRSFLDTPIIQKLFWGQAKSTILNFWSTLVDWSGF